MDPLVSLSWLAAHLEGPAIIVVDATLPPVGVVPVVDVHARYLEQHIPGAVFFDIDALSDHATPLPHMLPTAESFAESISALGIRDSATLVVYEQAGVFSAPRAWWMLRTMGAERVHVLDGDLASWRAAGYPVEAGAVTKPRADFHARLNADAVRSLGQVQQVLSTPPIHAAEQMVDARSSGRFTGSAPEPRAGIASGHMPGALNVPFTELVHGGRLKEVTETRAIFAAHGVDLERPITTTCGSGVTAAVLALALAHAGVAQVRLYDGSWAEYAGQPGAAIVREEPPKKA